MRLAVDTNVLIARVLWPDHITGRTVKHILSHHTLLIHEDTLREAENVLKRDRFKKYIDYAAIERFIEFLGAIGEPVEITSKPAVCRDPSDNMWLALALDGKADAIISGDEDLLMLHPFQGIPIFSPADYRERYGHV